MINRKAEWVSWRRPCAFKKSKSVSWICFQRFLTKLVKLIWGGSCSHLHMNHFWIVVWVWILFIFGNTECYDCIWMLFHQQYKVLQVSVILALYCVSLLPYLYLSSVGICPLLIFSQSDYLIQAVDRKFAYLMTNNADPDQLASSEANWSGSTLFAKAGHILAQQDQG